MTLDIQVISPAIIGGREYFTRINEALAWARKLNADYLIYICGRLFLMYSKDIVTGENYTGLFTYWFSNENLHVDHSEWTWALIKRTKSMGT